MFFENIKLALTNLAANKLRTFLTMLGIIIGIAAVIAIMTVGAGMNNSVAESMGSMGAGNINVYLRTKMTVDEDGNETYADYREYKDSDRFTIEMIADLQQHFEGRIKGVALTEYVTNTQINEREKYANVAIMGVNRTAEGEQKLKMLSGRSFTTAERKNAARVALVSDLYADNMFDGDYEAALKGQVKTTMSGRNYAFNIIGVYEFDRSKTWGKVKKVDVETNVYVPLFTGMEMNNKQKGWEDMTVVSVPGEDPIALAEEIQSYLNEKYYANNDTFETYAYTMQAYVDEMKNSVAAITASFMGVGAISLLVGGIGVMNIMVVTITERTREIGTRKALGATRGQIRLQFLTEAVVICLFGGIIGIIVGMIAGYFIAQGMQFSGTAPGWGVAAALAFSMAFGIFFGYYPANKAAKMNPIDALRYE